MTQLNKTEYGDADAASSHWEDLRVGMSTAEVKALGFSLNMAAGSIIEENAPSMMPGMVFNGITMNGIKLVKGRDILDRQVVRNLFYTMVFVNDKLVTWERGQY